MNRNIRAALNRLEGMAHRPMLEQRDAINDVTYS